MSVEILDLLAEANPHPDGTANPDVLSTASATWKVIDERRDVVQTQQPDKTQDRPEGKRWRGPIVAVAAFAAIILVVAAVALLAGDGSTEAPPATDAPTTTEAAPTTTEAVTTTTRDPAEEEQALALVMAAFDAWNIGDAEAWATFRASSDTTAFGGPIDPLALDWETRHAGAMAAAGSRFQNIDCESRGWSSLAWFESASAVGWYFVCQTSRTDLYREPVGLSITERFDVVIGINNATAVISDPVLVADQIGFEPFLVDFKTWLADTHPDVAETIVYIDHALPDAETASIALEYVEEFAESWDG